MAVDWSAVTAVVTAAATLVIAVATIAYTRYAKRLWEATSAQADISRYLATANLLQTLAAEAEKMKAADPSSSAMLDAFLGLTVELWFTRLAEDIDLKDPTLRDHFRRIEGILRGRGVDPAQVPWMKPILKKFGD